MPDPRTFLPLKPAELVLLLTLADGERHGYSLAQEIAERTGGAVQLEAGNLYRLVRRLLSDGLLAESGRRPAADADDERRRYYRVTPFGVRVARAELERLRGVLAWPAAQRLMQSMQEAP